MATPQPSKGLKSALSDKSKSFVIGKYRVDQIIGQGTYGKVRLGIHLETKEKVAVKVIEKAQVQSPKQIARLQREIRFLKLLHHPHIVRLYDVIETTDNIYIMMEYASGGELFDYIVANKRVKENEARSFFRMVLSAIDYCHQNSIIHRDLKPENLLLDDKKCIKIIDFGFGNNFSNDNLLDTFCGSPFYAAPEMILGKKYKGPEVDMWSLGVILFALLCGHLPFDDENMKELYKKIASGAYKCPDYLLPNARHLIGRLITVDPKKRATLPEILAHPWVNEGYNYSPPNYICDRPVIRDPNTLSKDTVNRLLIFGYKSEDIMRSFSEGQDFTQPSAIRSTYFLLLEMVTREQARMKREKQKSLIHEFKPKNAVNFPSSATTLIGDSQSSTNLTSPYEKEKSQTSIHVPTPAYTHHSAVTGKQRHNNDAFTSMSALKEVPPLEPSLSSKSIGAQIMQVANSSFQKWYSVPTNLYNSISDATSHLLVAKEQDQSRIGVSTSYSNQQSEDFRAKNGWFMNTSTTSSKNPQIIIGNVIAALTMLGIKWKFENDFKLICEVEANKVFKKNSPDDMVIDHKGELQDQQDTSNTIAFQLEICKISKSSLHGLYFKRLNGGVWNYKKVCNKLLSIIEL